MVWFEAGNPGDSLACGGPRDANLGGNQCLLGEQEIQQYQPEEEGRGREGWYLRRPSGLQLRVERMEAVGFSFHIRAFQR